MERKVVPKHQRRFPSGTGIFSQRYFLRTVSLSVPFFFLLHTFLGSGLYKAHPLKISLGSERFGGPMGRELTQKFPLSCGIYFIASAMLVNM